MNLDQPNNDISITYGIIRPNQFVHLDLSRWNNKKR